MFSNMSPKITTNHNQTLAPGIPGLATNHNQTVVRRFLPVGGLTQNHNQTLVRR